MPRGKTAPQPPAPAYIAALCVELAKIAREAGHDALADRLDKVIEEARRLADEAGGEPSA